MLPVSRNDPISIHALREEGDRIPRRESNQRADFYPRPPRGGRRAAPVPCYSHGRFLSTPSARRATRHKPALPCPRGNFYPRPPRGGRRCRLSGHRGDHTISIHALREEGDVGRVKDDIKPNQISIHALREEGDSSPEGERGIPLDFYPRPPRGGRRSAVEAVKGGLQFLSTPSARRATGFIKFLHGIESISIHALREEGDHTSNAKTPIVYNFYPRPPRGGRPFRDGRPDLLRCISIHALREEGDAAAPTGCLCAKISIHALREEGDPFNYEGKLRDFLISIHALREEGDFSLSGVTFVHFDFYPRPPRGGRPVQHRSGQAAAKEISIHALREEGDRGRRVQPCGRVDFYPRPPRGGRLGKGCAALLCLFISIHALREEGDQVRLLLESCLCYFYPRPPRGGRLRYFP